MNLVPIINAKVKSVTIEDDVLEGKVNRLFIDFDNGLQLEILADSEWTDENFDEPFPFINMELRR